MIAALREARRRHPSWGAQQLVSILSRRHPPWPWPARSTVCDLLSRHGLVPKKRQHRAIGHPGPPTSHRGAPNAVWSADFTGHFTTGDGRYGSPLTIPAGSSRFRLGCPALSSTSVAEATPVFTRVFKAFGLPPRIRIDHGGPCAAHTLARLAQLSAWGVRLGLWPACIAPGTPHQHRRHERRPRTLTADTTRPPGATRRAQPQKLTHFRAERNHARPHEARALHTPATCDEPSPQAMPTTRPPLAYPDRCEGRDVSATGGIRWHHHGGNGSHVGVGAYVGLEDIDEGVWNADGGPLTRGRLLARHRRIEEASSRLKRRR